MSDLECRQAARLLRRHDILSGFYLASCTTSDGSKRKITVFLPDVMAITDVTESFGGDDSLKHLRLALPLKHPPVIKFTTEEKAQEFINLWMQTKLAFLP